MQLEIQDMLEVFSKYGVTIDVEKAALFQRYQELIRQENKKYNLTRIIEPKAILEEHFCDALAWLEAGKVRAGDSLLDLGSGAGFPGIPIKIVFPELQLYLLEAVLKKTTFLYKVIRELKLKGVTLWQQRAEVLGRSGMRETFPWVTARALAPLPAALELALPLVRVGGYFWAWKGPAALQELKTAWYILERCGGEFADQVVYRLRESNKERIILIFKKVRPTGNSFPRRNGIPQKRPFIN